MEEEEEEESGPPALVVRGRRGSAVVRSGVAEGDWASRFRDTEDAADEDFEGVVLLGLAVEAAGEPGAAAGGLGFAVEPLSNLAMGGEPGQRVSIENLGGWMCYRGRSVDMTTAGRRWLLGRERWMG